MIKSFKDKQTESIYEGKSVRQWTNLRKQIEKRLQILDQATCIEDLKNLPSRFEALKGKRKGQYSIRINIQWRLCFTWKNDEPHDVEITDYH